MAGKMRSLAKVEDFSWEEPVTLTDPKACWETDKRGPKNIRGDSQPWKEYILYNSWDLSIFVVHSRERVHIPDHSRHLKESMIFRAFPRWDMLVPWRVSILNFLSVQTSLINTYDFDLLQPNGFSAWEGQRGIERFTKTIASKYWGGTQMESKRRKWKCPPFNI